jgi:hypothetical protein
MPGSKQASNLPQEVQRFILLSIPSVPYLEALLLTRKEKHRAWYASDVAQRLYIGEPLAAELLGQLHAAGIVAPDAAAGAYRYAPGTEELEQLLPLLEQCYATNLVEVTVLVHSKSGKKAQQFADAFKLRKDS